MKYYFLALGTVVVVCVGCAAMDGQQLTKKGEFHAPPAAMMQRPGPMVDGPGPGVMPPLGGPSIQLTGGMGFGAPMMPAISTSQVRFVGPDGMSIGWLIPTGYAENQLVAPARYNFLQGAAYRLKLTSIPGREGLTIYPTLQVYPAHPNTEAYLSHNSLPIQITAEDLDQVESNNFVTKVIYLPDAKFQELAIANVETLVSTRLDPGVDPIQEADKMGTIMAVLRMGNMDLEMPAAVQGAPNASAEENAEALQQVAYQQAAYQVDGTKGQMMPPMPIGPAGHGPMGIPSAIMVAGSGMPAGIPGFPPVSGGNMPMWGMPYTGTPIGLPGPTHIPLGGPASLQSHTTRNLSKNRIPNPVKHALVDVEHDPGLSLPDPVSYTHYKEKHPVYSPGELAYPAWAAPNGGNGAYCPPGQMQPQPMPQW